MPKAKRKTSQDGQGGIERDDVAYIMDTFPIVRKNDEKAFGEYRTKRLILEIHDELGAAAKSGTPYKTRLNPPPADPRVTHPWCCDLCRYKSVWVGRSLAEDVICAHPQGPQSMRRSRVQVRNTHSWIAKLRGPGDERLDISPKQTVEARLTSYAIKQLRAYGLEVNQPTP